MRRARRGAASTWAAHRPPARCDWPEGRGYGWGRGVPVGVRGHGGRGRPSGRNSSQRRRVGQSAVAVDPRAVPPPGPPGTPPAGRTGIASGGRPAGGCRPAYAFGAAQPGFPVLDDVAHLRFFLPLKPLRAAAGAPTSRCFGAVGSVRACGFPGNQYIQVMDCYRRSVGAVPACELP